MRGLCHLCPVKEIKEVVYCPTCDHWFCEDCRKKWFWRGVEAVKELLRGKHRGCCGPLEASHAE